MSSFHMIRSGIGTGISGTERHFNSEKKNKSTNFTDLMILVQVYYK